MADNLHTDSNDGQVVEESVTEKRLADALAQRLRVRRNELHLTQEQVAQRAGISRNHYQLFEAGLSDRKRRTPANPQLTTLVDLAHALEMSLSALVGGIEHHSR